MKVKNVVQLSDLNASNVVDLCIGNKSDRNESNSNESNDIKEMQMNKVMLMKAMKVK